jgi:energy-coupling factor transporter ATP-binding protein EcfA2
MDRDKDWKNEIKILLLGAGESGKSTFVKQMRIIHGQKYSDSDRLEFRPLIYHNILKGMKVLIEACRRLQIPLSNPENDAKGDLVVSGYQQSQELTPEDFSRYVDALKSLWADDGIQATLARSNEFQLVILY